MNAPDVKCEFSIFIFIGIQLFSFTEFLVQSIHYVFSFGLFVLFHFNMNEMNSYEIIFVNFVLNGPLQHSQHIEIHNVFEFQLRNVAFMKFQCSLEMYSTKSKI